MTSWEQFSARDKRRSKWCCTSHCNFMRSHYMLRLEKQTENNAFTQRTSSTSFLDHSINSGSSKACMRASSLYSHWLFTLLQPSHNPQSGNRALRCICLTCSRPCAVRLNSRLASSFTWPYHFSWVLFTVVVLSSSVFSTWDHNTSSNQCKLVFKRRSHSNCAC